jgi:hypothetical protein
MTQHGQVARLVAAGAQPGDGAVEHRPAAGVERNGERRRSGVVVALREGVYGSLKGMHAEVLPKGPRGSLLFQIYAVFLRSAADLAGD